MDIKALCEFWNKQVQKMDEQRNEFLLFSDNDVPVAFDVTQLAAVKVHQQLPQARVGGREVNLGLGFLARTYGRAQPAE